MKDRYRSLVGLGIAVAVVSSGCSDVDRNIVNCTSPDKQTGYQTIFLRRIDAAAQISAISSEGNIVSVILDQPNPGTLIINPQSAENIVPGDSHTEITSQRILFQFDNAIHNGELQVDINASCRAA